MTALDLNTLNRPDNIVGTPGSFGLEKSGDKACWKSRTVRIIAIGAGILATAALLLTACYLAAAIVGTITAITVAGCSMKYIYDRPASPASNWNIPRNTPARTPNTPARTPEIPASLQQQLRDPFRLKRFVDVQNSKPWFSTQSTHERALKEMQGGRKRSHWSWFELPVVDTFGTSDTADYFALKSLEEVRAYYNHPILKQRLFDMFNSINSHRNKTARDIMSSKVDAAKLKSCATIFYLTTRNPIFLTTLNQFFYSTYCSTASWRYHEWQQGY